MRAILIQGQIHHLARALLPQLNEDPNARPDVSHGYNYNAPQDTYQGALPEQSNNYGSAGETLPNFVPVQAHSGPALPPVYPDEQQPENFIPTGPSNVQLQGVPHFKQTAPEQQNSIESQALTTGQEAYRNSNDEQQRTLSTSYDATPSGIPQQAQQQFAISGNSQQQTQSTFSNSYQQQSVNSQNVLSASYAQDSQSDDLPPIITKHFYVHAAPEQPEESSGPRFVNVGRKQKNYKIIFIKAPTYGFNSQVIPIVQPSEKKTIVYVLSKKPSFNQDISLPPVPVTEPSKPEVFFIEYKTDREAQEAQQKIQGAYETSNLEGTNDNIFTNVGGTIGTAINSLQNQAASAFNTLSGQGQGIATGVANSIGSVVGTLSCAGGSSCSSGTAPVATSNAQTQTISDEQQQYNAEGTSQNVVSTNLVEAQSSAQSTQQQNDVNQQYLPPNQQ